MTTKLRPEVSQALEAATQKIADGILLRGDGGFKMRGVGRELLTLVEIGVRLGVAHMVGEGTHRDVAKKVVARILQAQPGEER